MAVQEQLIRKIIRNRISTTEIADCLDKSGALAGVMPLNRGHFRVGPVFFTYAFNESNWDLHEQIQYPPEGSVVVIELIDCKDRAPIGELMAKYMVLYRQVAAIVVNGPVRDAPHLIKENWPLWCVGVSPIGCHNRQNTGAPDPAILASLRARYEGAIAVCDDCGVVLVPASVQTDAFDRKLDEIEEQEDIWFDCIDRRKWTTYETVCLKKYLNG